MFLEGPRLAAEILRSSVAPATLFYTDAFARDPRHSDLMGALLKTAVPATILSEDVMGFVSDVNAAPGVVLTARRPVHAVPPPQEKDLVLFLDGMQNPQNIGAIARSAEAAGAAALVCAGGADPFGPKSLRASAGAALRLPLEWVPEPAAATRMDALLRGGAALAVADARGDRDYTLWDWKGPLVLGIGGETRGWSLPSPAAPVRLKIPMSDSVESLNAAVAAGILLFEARRRRNPP
jgi:TrmH family RNA methyltransferase